ncbi:AzlC family ABC transporter permease [Thermohalobacter berrensis]|uniref:Branched-chain amino acid ABC transporter permease n=1 Tax=Thermohalobacter berrensis TaxID=99594 RepID=A0A419SXU3_9FIRM|nr:AzlC family ABC transporter permease [Thermohalobacter berrensis]RKD30016.1 branched-chain amino acid ABC transporter permease [Thermohalobacter berrensis]
MKFTNSFISGMKRGLPIALGYVPIAITFGLIAKSQGVPNYISIMMSALVFAGASQFVAINLLALGTGYLQIVVTTFIVNLRHFLMTASISQRIKGTVSQKWMPVLAFGITDETFSFISLSPSEKLSSGFIFGINTIAYIAWVSGTALGTFLGKSLPEILQTSMGISLYVMFIGLLVPSFKKSRSIVIISLLSAGISSLLYWGPSVLTSIPKGWKIIITTVLASAIGVLIFPEEKEVESVE